MAHALPKGTGMMAAVLGADAETIRQACTDASDLGVCEVANYNCPGQIVISGETLAVEKARALLLERGVRRVMPLNVSGAFHSSLLLEASKELSDLLDTVEIKTPSIPVVSNVSGDVETRPVKAVLVQQIHSSVYFEKGIRRMIDMGVDTFIEVGPGKACSGFVKKTDRSVKVMNVENMETFEAVCKALR